MKKGLLIGLGCFGVIVVIALIAGSSLARRYNGFITMSKQVDGQWAQVENQLKRRVDLLPNLNRAVNKFTKQERAIYESIMEGRKAYGGAGSVEDKMDAYNSINSALSRLLVIVESNPEIKSDSVIRELMVSIEGTENRIAVERMRYNEIVTSFNTAISKFPDNIIAPMFGFKEKPLFEITKAESEVPVIDE